MSNPIFAAFAPDVYSPKLSLGIREQLAFFLATVLIATGLVGTAVYSLRPTVLAQVSRPVKRKRPDAPARLVDYLPGPSLDGNAVLWREWHRKRPTRWVGRFWTAYAIASALASLYVLGGYYVWPDAWWIYSRIHLIAAHVNAWQVAIGLLLLSVSAATTLAEERDRGSLDVILTTPLSTREIVWGKWWGTFAMVPRLAILPTWVACGAAMVSGGGLGLILMIGLILAYAAVITSAGLALATWVSRLGRVVSASVLGYFLIAAGWPALLRMIQYLPAFRTNPWDPPSQWQGLALASPFLGVYATTEWAARINLTSDARWGSDTAISISDPLWPLFWIGVYCALAAVLMFATLRTFDRCMGRNAK
jgi:ABC-type transport system involved in multi-copper enzyme maturation permease subunit